MSTAPIRGPIQIATHTAAYWTAQNTVLLLGQLGAESDTNMMKMGDGVTGWNALDYIAGSGGSGNLDGGTASTDYSGTEPIDGGGA